MKNRLNDFIRGELKRKKIRQKTAANYLNITDSTFSRRLDGQTEWTFTELKNLAELMEVSIETLFRY